MKRGLGPPLEYEGRRGMRMLKRQTDGQIKGTLRVLVSFITGSFELLHAQVEMVRGGRSYYIKPTAPFLMHSAVWDRRLAG